MIRIDFSLKPEALLADIHRMWERSARCIESIERTFDPARGAPVFTVAGRYTTRGWTEWTQGFQYGAALLQFDATGDQRFLEIGRRNTVERMAPHLTHFGVHDHGFNNISTYGHLLRLAREGRIDASPWEIRFYALAVRVSGAVQARRWTSLGEHGGYIYSFNGPHSLFADTIRSLRALGAAHALGHVYCGEHDERVSLLERLVQHAATTARWTVYYGEGRDAYDVRGRVAHESIFNLNDGQYRCPNSQQGYSPFTTWTRGLAWVMLGFAEELEFLDTRADDELAPLGGRAGIVAFMRRAAEATCDFYIEHTPTDGVPYWDTGAPGLQKLGDYLARPADPFNDHEPVDSSAAAIAAQGLLRFGRWLGLESENGRRYWQAGLTVLRTLLHPPYLNEDDHHQGLLLHSIYHRPNGWDYVPAGARSPRRESGMWGDYHLREAALCVQRAAEHKPWPAFWQIV